MKKVKYIGDKFYTLLTTNKIYDVIETKNNCILLENNIGSKTWYIANGRDIKEVLFEDIPLKYIRNETIEEILS